MVNERYIHLVDTLLVERYHVLHMHYTAILLPQEPARHSLYEDGKTDSDAFPFDRDDPHKIRPFDLSADVILLRSSNPPCMPLRRLPRESIWCREKCHCRNRQGLGLVLSSLPGGNQDTGGECRCAMYHEVHVISKAKVSLDFDDTCATGQNSESERVF